MSQRILSFLAYFFISLMVKTMKFVYIGKEKEEAVSKRESIILAFWHNRLLMFCYIYKNRKDAYIMISRSRDGELISRFVNRLGINSIRGSSSRGGKAAFKTLANLLKKGYHAAITPDGPRGPRYQAQKGVINLSRISGAPIIPATYNASRKKAFNSWDRFILPLPFSRIVVIYADPVTVPQGADPQIIEEKRIELENKLNEITRIADRYFEKGKS
jgi:lysophospholipid acyltransferase (LPLAT)-like uncharacterized protein